MFWAHEMYPVSPQVPTGTGVAAPTAYMGTDGLRTGWSVLVDPRNPLPWLGGLLLVTVGLAGFAGSVRLGPVRASVGAGED